MRQLKTHIIFAILLSIFTSCTPYKESTFIQTADSLLWANPDSCLCYIEAQEIEMKENNRARLIFEHALYKVSVIYNHDSILSVLSEDFIKNHDYRSAGEAKYIIGANLIQTGDYFTATQILKEAENLFSQSRHTESILQGMLYFNLGVAAERSRFFDMASEYYDIALPFFKECRNPLYIASVYHHLGKICTHVDLAISYLDSAYQYAAQIDDSFYKKEIEVVRALYFANTDSFVAETLINDIQYLCDSCHQNIYVGPLAELYLEHNNIIEAESLLDKLAKDTTKDIWIKEHYYSIKADILYKKNKKDDAYEILKRLHNWQTEQIEKCAFANTYIISQKYDVAKEQELRLQEQVKKQRAYIWIVVVLLVCICIGGYTYYINKKRKLKLQLSNEQKKRLEQELESDRAMLRARISERIEIAKELYAWCSHHNEAMPDILGLLSPKQAASDIQNWKNFYDEFNLCYNNVLAKLKEKYPALTTTDLQYIALTLLQYDTTDMSFILRIGKQTIWNRRTNVKRHMGMPDDANLNKWILNDMTKEYGIVELGHRPKLPKNKIRRIEEKKTK